MLIGSSWGLIVLAGLIVCIIGIIFCGKAGMMKERQLSAGSMTDPHGLKMKTEYKFGLGIFVSIVSGVLSACFNFGLESGKPMAMVANEVWTAAHPGEGEFLFRNNVIYVVLLWGGLTTNFIWCMILNARNKTFGDYSNKKAPLRSNYLFAALAGTTWFLQFFSMVWEKVNLVMGPVHGFCIWLL